jgi:S-adenosylmethionine:tRNA ribosyltransferase-isomerase
VKPATTPRSAKDIRVLVVDGASGAMRVAASADIASLFEPGDLLVVNDAATLPASLFAKTDLGEDIELRLVTSVSDRVWTVALLGRGDYHTRTEDRPLPPSLDVGNRLFAHERIVATVTRINKASARLVDVTLSIDGRPDASLAEIWSALYRAGNPVQYAHVPDPLALWDIQNVFASRPWAVEMPSAGRVLRVETLLELRKRGVEIATVTHAAGLSSIGDAVVDAMLPLPERYEVTEETWEAIERARKRGRRVVAIGTSAARALEGSARARPERSEGSAVGTHAERSHARAKRERARPERSEGSAVGTHAERSHAREGERARAGTKTGITDLRIGRETRRAIVDAILTGVHEADTSHFALLGAFTSAEVLARALARAESEGLLGHELGDACLVWGEPRENLRPAFGQDSKALRRSDLGSGVLESRAIGREDRSRSRPAYR